MDEIETLFARNAPAPVARFTGFARYNFVGGHNDPEAVPLDDLAETAARVIREQGRRLATYNPDGPLGHLDLRRFVADKLRARRGIARADAEEVLITSGSLQGLDLVNALLLEPGDTVLIERETYGGMLERLARRDVRAIGVPMDADGLDVAALETILADLAREGTRPKFLYTIPTVQNPTGTVLAAARRPQLLRLAEAYGFAVFEDECYAELLWEGDWPRALAGYETAAPVIHIGSFSKTLAPALRLGYVHAPWPILARLLALKTDAGTPSIEQMIVADYFGRCFESHIAQHNARLRAKAEVVTTALEREFGTAADFARPRGGIFVWVELPRAVDATALAEAALAEGVAITPGADWSTVPEAARSCFRLCFALASENELRAGIAKLAEICHRETGIPVRGANRTR
jgi:2-aminoadipate transaminase